MKHFLNPITNINLKLIQGFVLVGQQKSFKRAAELSGFTQSAMSAQIRTLEEQLGIPLFNRTTRNVELTEEGAHLFRSAKRAIEEIGVSLADIQNAIDLKTGHVSIACSPSFAMDGLAGLIEEFGHQYPDVSISIREASIDGIVGAIMKDGFDFGIGPVVEAPDLAFEHLMSDPIVALFPTAMVPTRTKSLPFAELAEMPLLLLNETTAFRQQLNEIAADKGVQIRGRFEFSQASTLVAMAEAGLGVALVPDAVAQQQNLKASRVIKIRDTKLLRMYAVITPTERNLSPAASRMVQILKLRQGFGLVRKIPVETGGAAS